VIWQVPLAAVLAVLPLAVVAVFAALAAAVVGDRVRSLTVGIALMELSMLSVAVGALTVWDVAVSITPQAPVEWAVALALVPIPFAIERVSDWLLDVLGATQDDALDLEGESLAAAVLLALVLVGPAEELLYRGVVLGLLDDPLGTGPALVVMALLFGLVHYPSYGADSIREIDLGVAVGLCSTALAGLGFGVLYLVTGSLVAPIVTHSLYDAALFVRERRAADA